MPHETITIDTDQWSVVPRKATGEMLDHVMGISIAGTLRHWDELLACAPRPEQNDSYVTIHIDHHDRLECCRRLLEIIAVRDSENPQEDAKQELVAHGFWEERPEPVQQSDEPASIYVAFSTAPDGHIRFWTKSKDDANKWTARSGIKCKTFYAHQQPAPRPAFYVDKQSRLSCTHKVAPCDIPVWCSDADVVMKLMLALHDVNTAAGPVPTSERLPTEADADPWRFVNWWNAKLGIWQRMFWNDPEGTKRPDVYPLWQPTGLQRPAEVSSD